MALVVKNPLANTGNIRDVSSIPGSGRSTGEANGAPPQYSCLQNPMDSGAWRAMVLRVTKSLTRLKWLSTHHTQHARSSNLRQLKKKKWRIFGHRDLAILTYRNVLFSSSVQTLYILMDWVSRSKPVCAFWKINHDSESIRKLCIHLLIATQVKMAESNKNPFCYLAQFVRLEKWDWISKPQASWLQSAATQLMGFFLLYLQLFW